ncbi:hypothetical protein DPEC_G00199400 [Dallia pectoralis]|uniref:Uncharacterized protein n=1 Tax=Dallia pectoralis TaxID=75939 RepID=A0ACC2G8E8_DALPE|nr:hypothetical protein DPEC_G00199400 [Dallia pectoralis]
MAISTGIRTSNKLQMFIHTFVRGNNREGSPAVGQHQAEDRREREWLVGEFHRAAARDRESDRRQREVWQRRCEPRSPDRYRREPAKRSLSNSSYRELEAWAARYSHSLPRRRRLEAGLWGGAHGSQENDRVPERAAWGHRGGAMHLIGVPSQPREWGPWERTDTQPTISHRWSQVLTPDKTYPLDTKKNPASRCQRRVLSQPPGYIPPPPYNAPQNISPALQHAEKYSTKEALASVYAAWDCGARRHTYSTAPRKKDYSGPDVPRERAAELINEEWKQRTWSDPGGHRQEGQAVTGQWTGSPANPQIMAVQSRSLSPSSRSPEQHQTHRETDSLSANTQEKVCLKKRRRGETIFCLVSRMGGVAGLSSFSGEPPLSLPLLTTPPLTTALNSLGRESQNTLGPGARNDSPKLADEIDSGLQFLQPDSSVPPQIPASIRYRNHKPKLKGVLDWKGSEQEAAHRKELLRAVQSRPKLQEMDSEAVLPEGTSVKALSPVSRRKENQAPVSVKYPLWREPSSIGTVKSENPSPSYLTWKFFSSLSWELYLEVSLILRPQLPVQFSSSISLLLPLQFSSSISPQHPFKFFSSSTFSPPLSRQFSFSLIQLSPFGSPTLQNPSSRAESPEIQAKAFTSVLSTSTRPATHIEEPKYPKALWDAVKCIRKHTAPDSENEEEGSELWDPESAARDGDFDLGFGEMYQRSDSLGWGNMSGSEKRSLEVAKYLEVEGDNKNRNMLVASTHYETSSEKEDREDDTLSCSSTDSHCSGHTVIMTDYADVVQCVTDGHEWSCTVGPKRYVVVEGQGEEDRGPGYTAEPQNEGYRFELHRRASK